MDDDPNDEFVPDCAQNINSQIPLTGQVVA